MSKNTAPALPRMRLMVSAIAFGLMSAVALAQDTSSSVTGRVLDGEGAPVAGAVVEILHTPSGTRKIVTTDENGRYSSKGLRVGGGFVVSVSKDGMEATKQDDVELRLGEVGTVNLVMGADEATLGEVTVTASRMSDIFDPNKMGAGTNVTRDQIEALPSINRSIEDYVRLDPRIVQVDKERGGLSAAGQNSRYNNITIDGVSANDEFGLNDNGFPALNQPISLDAIEELNINIAGYDVTQSDFTGANINAVTKSGTNEFKGSVYGYYRSNNWTGDNQEGQSFTGFDSEETFGLTFGGPIITDKLFFFVSYENFTGSNPAPTTNERLRNGALGPVVTAADLAAITARASALGITTGSFAIDGVDNEDEKIIVKLDWNISDSHRAALRYGRTEGSILRTPGVPALRTNQAGVSFSDYWYVDSRLNKNLTAQLYSDWSDTFSTELSLSKNSYESVPTNRQVSPEVNVSVPAAVAGTGNVNVSFGTERSRQANILDTDTTVGFLKGNLFIGDHTVSFGADYKRNEIYNLFLQDAFGTYDYNSLADFQSGRISRYRYNFPVSGGIESAAAEFGLSSYGFFLQDNWVVNSNLTVNYGARIDIPEISDRPLKNNAAEAQYGFDNSETIDGNYTFQPRAGFNYTFDSDRNTQLRGGVGLFAGSSPNVWLSNSFTNSGLISSGYDLRPVGIGSLPFTFVRDPLAQPRPTATAPAPNIDFISRNFEQPTTWKGSLAFERELPWFGLVGSAEVILTQTDNNLFYEHLNLGTPTARLPDGRLSYWSSLAPTGFSNPEAGTLSARRRANASTNFNNVLLLKNTSKGYSDVVTVSLTKPMADNWAANLSYTHSDGKDSNPGTSSVSLSSWSSRLIVDPNDDVSSRSNYIFKDRITANMTYRHFFFDDLATSISAFYEGRSGRPFSYVFGGDANGDNANQSNDLFYIPKPGEVIFRPAGALAVGTTRLVNDPVVEAAFFNYVNSVEYLRNNQGSIARRNAEFSPWISQVDIRLTQDLPGFADIKGQLFLDILNFGNLLNKDWGIIEEASFPYSVAVARFAGVQDGKYVYQFAGAPTGFLRKDVKGESRWAAQIGVKFSF